MVRRNWYEFGALLVLLLLVRPGFAAGDGAVISGVVRDAQGVPQMGALVQILSADTTVRATAFTDLHGRYAVARLLPGLYAVRASAALFLPASRDHLRLQPDHRAIVDLTLSTLFEPSTWLPARTRSADEPSDDWSWTLRSAASRPMLKLAKDGSLTAVGEGRAPAKVLAVRASVNSGSKSFGAGEARIGVEGARESADGSTLVIGTEMGRGGWGDGATEALRLSTTYERAMGPAGLIATRVEYRSDPEVMGSRPGTGMSVLAVTSAEKFELGDMAEVEAGSRTEAIRGPVSTFTTRPFLRVTAHPAQQWEIAYRLATSTDEQDFDDAMLREARLPTAATVNGRAATEMGMHQEIAISRRTAATMLMVAYYADALSRVALEGSRMAGGDGAWVMEEGGSISPNMLVDRSNGAVRALVPGYGNTGFDILLRQNVGHNTWIALQYCTGSAMTAEQATAVTPAAAVGVVPVDERRSQAATIAVKSNISRTGTKLRMSYRMQPGPLVSSVDPFDVMAGGNFLSVQLRQPLRLAGYLPQGFEITVDGTNLLAQGYQRSVGMGEAPLFLASSPTNLQAGLSFTF